MSATVLPFPSPCLTQQHRADLMRWAAAAAPFGIAEVATFFCENEGGATGYDVVSLRQADGAETHQVFRPHGARLFVALDMGTHRELGRSPRLLDALNAVRPVLPSA